MEAPTHDILGSLPWNYIFIAAVVFMIGYFILSSITPGKSKALSKAKPLFKTYQQVTKLSPFGYDASNRLCDYYFASSSYSIFPGAAVYDYVSDEILPLVIKSGARLVELEVYSNAKKEPVVGLKNQKLGTDFAYNSVPFSACCVSIINNAFNSLTCPVATDPFILSLVFNTDDTVAINACAEILKETCRTHLLDYTYGYQRKNVAIEPISNLESKIIIVSGDNVKGTLMEEMVNLSWSSSNLRRLTYMQAAQTHDPDELVTFNRNNITMVVPDASSDLTNSNPTILLSYGCQWSMMNYGSPDAMMELYIGDFQENSVVLKPQALRALKVKKYKTPTMPDPSLSFQPMQKTTPIYSVTV
jgi:hypothetical protein